MNLPYAESCEQNKQVIHETIASFLEPAVNLLEIGSGTGQHAVYFASQHQQLSWQTSDRTEYMPGIIARVKAAGLSNLPAPIALDVCGLWPNIKYDLIFTANTLHIMSEVAVVKCIAGSAEHLNPGACFITYGPFNYQGSYTSDSNARFDDWLKSRDSDSGIKDFEWVNEQALQAGLVLVDDIAMPANNRVLIWRRDSAGDYL